MLPGLAFKSPLGHIINKRHVVHCALTSLMARFHSSFLKEQTTSFYQFFKMVRRRVHT